MARTQQGRGVGGSADARVAALLARHGATLMRVARQASFCHDDAADALQRALEIYVRRLDTVEVATEGAWMKVVVRHEAYAIRRSRGDCVADPDLDLDTVVPAADRSVEEQVLSGDRVGRSAEALRALKPDEARALMLKAHGLSYEEIGRHCGWTYTKVNRCITEGRRRFMAVYAALETGDACAAFAPALEALAAGVASSQQLLDLRPHLRRCSACRATVRDLHLSKLRRVSLFAPVPGLGWILERLGAHAPTPAPSPPPPLPAPTAEELERIEDLGKFKVHVTQLLHRANTSDLAQTGVQIAASTTGGRAATVGTIVGLCVTSLGAGTVCVVRGVVPDALDLFHQRPAPAKKVARTPEVSATAGRARPLAKELRVVHVRPTPTPTPTPTGTPARTAPKPRPRTKPRRAAAPSPSADPSRGTTPVSHEYTPISPAPPAAPAEFAAAPASGGGSSPPPAAAPATGGGEFGP